MSIEYDLHDIIYGCNTREEADAIVAAVNTEQQRRNLYINIALTQTKQGYLVKVG